VLRAPGPKLKIKFKTFNSYQVMSKLDNLNFYSKLEDLFDTYPPQEVPKMINEAALFVKYSLKAYETKNKTSVTEAKDGYNMLVWVRQVFEESLAPEGAWCFVIENQTRGYKINIKPFHNFLSDNPDFVPILESLTDTWHLLLNEKNIESFKKVQPIMAALKNTFNDSITPFW